MATTIQIFSDVYDKKGQAVPLERVINDIKNGVVSQKIEKLRTATASNREKIKNSLPCVTFSGTFKEGRLDTDIIDHSGLICLDFDKVDDMDTLWAELLEFPYLVAMFVSPSGNGIKAVIRIEPEKSLHRAYFKALKTLFPAADQSGVNESRLCFLSYDKDIYFNDKAPVMPRPAVTPIEMSKPLQRNGSAPIGGNREEDIVVDIHNFLLRSGHSITYNYNDWLKVGYALINTFDPITAERLFCLLSSIDVDKYDEAACRKTIAGISKHNSQARGFGYIVSAATLCGWSNKNEYTKKHTATPPSVAVKKNPKVQQIGSVPFLYIRTTKSTKYIKVDNYKLLKYIEALGYVKIKFEDGRFRFFKLSDARIREVEIADMTSELRQTINDLPDTIEVGEGEMEIHKEQLHTLVFDVLSEVFTEKKLNYTTPLNRGFLKDTKDNSFFTFANKIVSVTKEEIVDFGYENCSTLVWSDDIINHNIEIEQVADEKNSCEFATFLWYLCGQDADRFLQLRTALGYLLRTYHDPSLAVAVVLTEEKVVDGAADGGTGKGIFSKALEYLRSVYVVDGKLNKVNSQFAFQRYDLRNTVVSYQDGEFDMGFSKFFNIITDGLTIERKNNKELFLPFKATKEGQFEAPTWLITTNKPIKAEGHSVKRRLHICEVSSWWKDHLPYDHFGHNLFFDWDTKEWNGFYNFMFRCCQDFLKLRLFKVEGINAELNNLISLTNRKFVDWFHDFMLNNAMFRPNMTTVFGAGYKGKPFANRNDFYRQIADYCGWGYVENAHRVEVTQASVRGSNNQVLRWLEIGCRTMGIGINDRSKGTMEGKSVSTFEFTLDTAAIARVRNWLIKYHYDAAKSVIYGGVTEDVSEEEEVPF